MQITNATTPTAPRAENKKKIGSQDYPANPSLDEWAKTAEIDTVPEFFRMAVQKNPDGRYIGGKVDKNYEYSTYKETEQKVERFASALISAGIQPTDRVAAFAENSPDWRVADFGISYTGAILTCCLADYTPERVEYVLKDSGSKMIMVDTKERLDAVLGAESRLPDLKTIIVTGDVDLSQVKSEKNLVSLKDFMASGEASLEANRAEMEARIQDTRYDDIGSIVYTSGSTGNPKGVLLSHGNVLSSVEGILKTINNNPEEGLKSARRDDHYASILPLGHVMGRVADYALTAEGGMISYPGNLVNFAKDLKELKPSVLAITPLFLHKIYDNVEHKAMTKNDPAIPPFVAGLAVGAGGAALGGAVGALAGAGLGGGALQWGLGLLGAVAGGAAADAWITDKARNTSGAELFEGSLKNSKEFYEAHGEHKVSTRIKHELAEKFVFGKVKDQVDVRLGGNVRLMMSGGAPLSAEAETLMRASGYGIAQGYGLAETSAGGLMNNPACAELGTGGSAHPLSEVRLGEGEEIQIKGPTVMTGGYLNKDEKTKESFTADGWYRTGDTGKVVKVTGPVSGWKLAGLTGAGAAVGTAVGSALGHPALGGVLGGLATGLGAVFTGAARTEGEDHYIIKGRIKSQFKLPGGEYVTPEPIEASLMGSPFIGKALVVGAKDRDLVGALIQPKFDTLTEWCKERGLPTEPAEMVKHPDVIKLYDKEAAERSSGFQKHESVRRVGLLAKELSGDEITNKGEVMRSIVTERYAGDIAAIFA